MEDRLHRGLLALALGLALLGASLVAAWNASGEQGAPPGAEDAASGSPPGAAEPAGSAPRAAEPAGEQEIAPDNTGRNVRDREGGLTPMDQGNDASDLAITQHIRRSVVNNDRLSTNAQNVKIITVDGVVTLRGPVETEEERAFIVAAAKSAPQVRRVEDQLEVDARGGE